MAEDFDKSEDATPYKLEEARKKGQVGKSMEFTSMISLVVMMVGFVAMLPTIGQTLAEAVQIWLAYSYELANDSAAFSYYGKKLLVKAFYVIAPVILLGVVGSIVASYIHAGPVFSFFPLKPDFSKLNPAKGFKKIFSRRSLVEVAKLLLKLIAFSSVAYFVWKVVDSQVLFPHPQSIHLLMDKWHLVLSRLVLSMLVVFVIFSLFDLWFSKREFARQMKMSTRDVKDEHKRREGNPEIKSKRKKDQAELLKKFSSLTSVKDADVVITNPTHVAVALKYRPKEMALPVVLAKGQGAFARLIRMQASRYGVPLLREPLVARKLLAETDIKHPIPLDAQHDVAAIYREIVKLPNCKVFS